MRRGRRQVETGAAGTISWRAGDSLRQLPIAMPLLILAAVALAIIAWLLREPLFAGLRRRRVRRQPFPPEWRQILRRRVPLFRTMPADLQLQLKKHILVFVAEKAFVGCAGLVVDEEIRITIAAQACLLILNRRGEHFGNLREVLVYPGGFVAARSNVDAAGVMQSRHLALAGESSSRGQVVVSWDDAVAGAAAPDDGRNVVIHEFAHQLDQADGVANGAPPMYGRARRERWARVMGDEFAQLQQRADARQPSVLDNYGATDPAEFFAVASEALFEQPKRLATEHAALYAELRGFYRVDPSSWQGRGL